MRRGSRFSHVGPAAKRGGLNRRVFVELPLRAISRWRRNGQNRRMNTGFHPPAGRSAHYQDIVDRVVAMTHASRESEIRIADICRAMGISPRALGRAFRAIHDTSPSRYLCGLRLVAARQALLSADAGRETVTHIALRFGFRELGRFAALYRDKFGESPSATLRHSSPDAGDRAKHRGVGTGDATAGVCDQQS